MLHPVISSGQERRVPWHAGIMRQDVVEGGLLRRPFSHELSVVGQDNLSVSIELVHTMR